VSLGDNEWKLIRPLLPPKAGTSRPGADDRVVLNRILYVLLTGCRWMDMPKRYGHYSTAFRRIAMRCERLAATFLAFIQVACIAIHLRILQ